MSAPIRPDFIRSLCLALAHRVEAGRLFVILSAYFDESGTHGGSPITVMAGFMGNVSQWGRFEKELTRLKAAYGFRIFHATSLKSRKGEFAGWSKDRCLSLVFELANAVGNLLMEGVTMRLSNPEFHRDYRSDAPKKVRLDTAYGLAFRGCLLHLVTEAQRRLGHHRKFEGTSLDVILEQGHRHSGDAERVFNEVKAALDKEGLPILRTFVKAKKEESEPLMAADFLAYTAYSIGIDAHVGKRTSPLPPNDGPPHRTGLTHIEFELDGLAKLKARLVEKRQVRYPSSIPSVVAPYSGEESAE